jgi:hypothetical protein
MDEGPALGRRKEERPVRILVIDAWQRDADNELEGNDEKADRQQEICSKA